MRILNEIHLYPWVYDDSPFRYWDSSTGSWFYTSDPESAIDSGELVQAATDYEYLLQATSEVEVKPTYEELEGLVKHWEHIAYINGKELETVHNEREALKARVAELEAGLLEQRELNG